MKKALLCAAALLATPATAAPPSEKDVAWDITEGLTTEIGPRLAGTAREAAARDWAVARLKALGFANVRVEPFTFPGWVRGAETAQVIAPFPHSLAVTALGYSAPTLLAGLRRNWSISPALTR